MDAGGWRDRSRTTRPLDQAHAFPANVQGLAARILLLRSGLRVRVVEAGDPAAPLVVLVPGWACSAYLFRYNIAPLAGAGFRVVALDLKGQGWSDKPDRPGEYTLPSFVAHMLDVLTALGDDRPARLVGVSLGGAVAARLAMEAPARVARLVLCGSVGLGHVRLVGIAQHVLRAAGGLIPARVPRPVVELALRSSYGDPSLPSARDVDEYHAPASDPAFGRAQLATLREMDWSVFAPADMARLVMPVLVLFGTRDAVVEASGAEGLARHAPDARVTWVPGAGHIPVEESPDFVNAAIIGFLQRRDER